MRIWYWVWDDWFSVGIGWLLPAVALGILAGALAADLRFERHRRTSARTKPGE